jgi:hypothetical protein
MGCGATPDWAEGVTISDYDDEAMLSQGQSQFAGVLPRQL